jgi:hypothetical protein
MTSSGFDFATTDASTSGVYLVTHDDLVSIDAAASHAGWMVRRVDLRRCPDRSSVLHCIASGLDIPESWHRNWDALAYGLRDLTWLPATGYVFLFDHAEELRQMAKAEFRQLLDVFDEAGFSWAERGIPFWAFFGMPESAFETLES